MRFSPLIALALALGLTACTSVGVAQFGGPGDDDHGDEGPGDEGPGGPPRGMRPQLFISPAGQPFRAQGAEPYPSAAWFAQADRDHDGKLTRAEFRADAEAWFARLDLDHDGQISMPEVTHWENEVVPEITRPTFGGYGGGRGGPLKRNEIDTRAQGAATYSLINEPHPIRGADADFSMGVSKAEWAAAADRRFDLLDKAKAGALTLETLPRTPAQATPRKMKDRGPPPMKRGRRPG